MIIIRPKIVMNGIFLVRLAKTFNLGLRAFKALKIPIKINKAKYAVRR